MKHSAAPVTFKAKALGRDVTSLGDLLPPRTARRIQISAVNETARSGETRLNRLIRDTLNVGRADVDDVINRRTTREDDGGFAQRVTVTKQQLYLKSYKPRSTKKGISVRFYKKGAPGVRKPTALFKTAFADKRTGGNIFRRRGKKRLPILKMAGPTPVGALTRRDADVARIAEETGDMLLARYMSKLDYEWSKILAKRTGR